MFTSTKSAAPERSTWTGRRGVYGGGGGAGGRGGGLERDMEGGLKERDIGGGV